MSARTLADSVPPVAGLSESRQPQQVSRVSAAWERSQTLIPTLAALVLLFAMLIYAEIAYGRVFHAGTMSSLLVSFAPTIILAVGMTFVIISGGIDLSVGAVFGLISGVMIQYFDVQPFIATLAMMFLARGLASILSTTPVIAPEDSPILLLGTDWKIFDGPKVNDFTVTPGLIIALLVVLGGFFFMHRSRLGRTVYAIGGNESSAQLMGLRVARARIRIYVVSGALAGLAAIVYTAEVGGKAQNVTGVGWELDAIAAVVIGGTLLTGGYGYVLGSVVGVFVLAALRLIITKDGNINPEYLTIITGAVLLVFVLLQRVLTRRRAG